MRYLIGVTIAACFLLFIDKLEFIGVIGQIPDQDIVDYTTLITDIAAFIIIGILGYIATKINTWLQNNKEWKYKIENLERKQSENDARQTKAIELLIADIKSYKEFNSKQIDEIVNDFNGLNTRTIQNTERILNLKEDINEVKNNMRR